LLDSLVIQVDYNAYLRKPLIVTYQGLLKAGIVARVTKSLDNAGIGYVIFDGVQPNPTEHNIYDGLVVYRDADCDMVIGLGGGSAMDALCSTIVTNQIRVHVQKQIC
jgi:alcohol dehydrogenase